MKLQFYISLLNPLLPKSFSYSYTYLKQCPTVNIYFEGSGEVLIVHTFKSYQN